MPAYLNDNALAAKAEIRHLFEIQRIDAAIIKIDDLLSHAPNDPDALYLKAVCLVYIENYDEAMLLCSDALSNGGDAGLCHYLMATVHRKKKQYIEAEKHILEALRMNPLDADILADYGELMYMTGHDKKAFTLIEESLRVDPGNSNALDFLIKYSLASGNKTAHAEVLSRYMYSSDSEFSALIRIGLSQVVLGNFKEAREICKQAYLMSPTNADLLETLQELDVESHPYFFLVNKVEKVGGPKIIWVSYIILMLTLSALKLYILLGVITAIYLFYVVYTWTTIPVRRYLKKRLAR